VKISELVRRCLHGAAPKVYFRELLIDVNKPLRLVPRPFTAAMIAIEIRAAIKPYSMAVAPVSSRQNLKTKPFICPALNILLRNGGLCAASDSGRCSAIASSHGARIQIPRSSSVFRITGTAFD